MSIEQVSENMETPLGHIQEPKSGGKKWLFGGCGCLTFLAVLCIGGGALIWIQFGKPIMDFINENVTYVQSSEEVQAALGSPVTTGQPEFSQSVENGQQSIELSIPVSGPKGNGTMVLRGRNAGGEWTRDEIYLEIDGQRIDLDPDAELKLDIDDGL